MIDTLIATLIVTVGMLGAVGIFFSATTMSNNSAQNSTAASLARLSIEQAKSQGFFWCTTIQTGVGCDGTTTAYYDVSGNSVGSSSASFFTVTTTVSSSSLTNLVPDNSALRTATVTVKRTADLKVLETTATYLTWGGI